MPQDVLQSLKKQCNPLLKKSFKERNPDVDMDEIQNNPNVPEDVKAAITGALSLTLEEDEAEEGGDTCDESGPFPPVDNVETFDDDYIMMSDDDGKKSRRKRLDENDEDWLTGRRKGARPRKAKRKHKKRSKTHSENGSDSAKQTMDDKESKVKKKRSKKSTEMNNCFNGTLESSVPSSVVSNSVNSSFNCTLDSTLSSSTNASSLNGFNQTKSSNFDSMTNGIGMSNSVDPVRKESKQKKTPKKCDNTNKTIDGLVKKTSRRQITSISAIMACIEAVVRQGNDVSISDVPIKTEKMEESVPSNITVPEMLSSSPPMKSETFDNNEAETIDACIKFEPKKKPRRKSTIKKTEASQLVKLDGVPPPPLPPPPMQSSSLNNVGITTGLAPKSNTKKPRANGTSKSKTSMRTKSNSLAK